MSAPSEETTENTAQGIRDDIVDKKEKFGGMEVFWFFEVQHESE